MLKHGVECERFTVSELEMLRAVFIVAEDENRK